MHQSTHWYLKQIKIFADLPEKDKKGLQKLSRMVSYPQHEHIDFPGQLGDAVFFLKEGRVKISRINESGQEATICFLEPGEIFGEVEALGGISRETLVQAP